MNKKRYFNLLLLFVAVTLAGCFSSQQTMKLNSINLLNQLHQGMSYAEVENIMGKPKFAQNSGSEYIARWNLQQMYKGYIPYDMVFNSSDKTLISWSENSKAFEQQQTQLQIVANEIKKMEAAQAAKTSGGGAVANFENNAELMAHFQGAYYSFTSSAVGGSSERKVSFCPNGRYISTSESSYSGGAGTSGAWGNASQGGGGGTWKITGTKSSGTIAITSNGKTSTYKYSSCGNGCLYLGSTKYAYEGVAECR
jgi:hypothetical protein